MQAFYFNTNDYTPDTTYDLIPNGNYTAMVVEAKEMVSKNSGIPYATLKVEIVDGPFKGRKIYDNLFLNHPNPTAQSIAKRKLYDIAMALNILEMKGAEDFLFKPLSVNIAINKEDKNEVKRYLSKNRQSFAAKEMKNNDSIPF